MFNFFKKKIRYRIVYQEEHILQEHWKVEIKKDIYGWVYDCRFRTQSEAENYIKKCLENNRVVKVYEAE